MAMRPPAQIKDWLGIDQMFRWLQEATNEASHKRRMAIWLTYTGKLHAHKVADVLGISTQAVWLWIRQYNQAGPTGLVRNGRGGRRRSAMSLKQEIGLLAPLIQKARAGHPPKPAAIRQIIQEKLGRSVSMSYIYQLLRRHGWADILARSHTLKTAPKGNDTFADLSRPWQRED
jgi:transposase